MFHKIVRQQGWSEFRNKQINHAMFAELVNDWVEASSLPKEIREYLIQNVPISTIKEVDSKTSAKQDTIKTLFELEDKNVIEGVLMMHHDRNTVCVSSQSGCPVGCLFCATGKLGFQRNLTAREIVDQVLYFARKLPPDQKISNIVFMGMGEPMLNLKNVSEAVRILTDDNLFAIGKRKITISTSGYLEPLQKFLFQFPHIGLAVSLHAPNQKLREQIMPKVAKANHIDDLIWLCHNYSKKTKRRVSYEYILIEGVNDDLEYARELASILHDHLYFVNLIPYNPPSKDGVNKIKVAKKKEKIVMKKPNSFRVNRFKKELMRLGVPVAVRVAMGADIAGACGQLAGE